LLEQLCCRFHGRSKSVSLWPAKPNPGRPDRRGSGSRRIAPATAPGGKGSPGGTG
jgi:hypothetical protein